MTRNSCSKEHISASSINSALFSTKNIHTCMSVCMNMCVCECVWISIYMYVKKTAPTMLVNPQIVNTKFSPGFIDPLLWLCTCYRLWVRILQQIGLPDDFEMKFDTKCHKRLFVHAVHGLLVLGLGGNNMICIINRKYISII